MVVVGGMTRVLVIVVVVVALAALVVMPNLVFTLVKVYQGLEE